MNVKRSEKAPEIPTSSMADIAFLLIVFFMVTTVFSANKGMEHVLPPEQEAGEPEDAILIKVNGSGGFLLDRQNYSMADVERIYDYLLARLQVNRKKPIILAADGEALYGEMIAALDVVMRLEADLAVSSPGYQVPLTIATKSDVALFPEKFR